MARYLRKYLFKPALYLVVAAIITAVSAAITFNVILAKSKTKIILSVDKSFPATVSIGNVFYLPPNIVVVKNVSIRKQAAQKQSIATVPAVWIMLSLPRLLAKGQVLISGVNFYKPAIDYSEFSNFLSDNFEKIAQFLKNLPKQDIKIFVKGAELAPTEGSVSPDYTTGNLFLKIKGNSVSAICSVGKGLRAVVSQRGREIKRLTRYPPLRCVFKGILTDSGISIKNLELAKEDFYIKLWGDYSGNAARLQGLAFMGVSLSGRGSPKPALNLAEKIKGAVTGGRGLYPDLDLSKVNLQIFNIDCQVSLKFPRIRIERMSFFLNDNLLSLKGSILFSRPLSASLLISLAQAEVRQSGLTSGGQAGAYAENFKKAELGIEGVFEGKTFKGSGMLSLDFAKKKKEKLPLERLRVGFKELTLPLTGYPRLDVSLGKASLFCLTESNPYRIFFNGLNASIDLQNEKSKFINFSSLFYGGSLKGWGRMDFDGLPARFSSAIRFKDVNANGLSGLLVHFSKVYGRMLGRAYFNSYPSPLLKGGMVMEDGYLRDFEFFKWLADSFGIPSLKRIDFTRASSNFIVDSKGASLGEIKLEAKDVNLSGYFNLGVNDLVSSKLSLAFSRELLKESASLAPLLKITDQASDALNFHFQLSGVLDAMNFQWLDSELKKEIQGAIPGFVERKIERGVENLIEPAK